MQDFFGGGMQDALNNIFDRHKLNIFDRNKDNPLIADYFDRRKGKIYSSSPKYVDEIHKIHLPLTDNVGIDLINLCHESIHHLFAFSPISCQLRDLMLASDFIDSFEKNLNQLHIDVAEYFKIKNEQLFFTMDMASGKNDNLEYNRYQELCLLYETHYVLNERKNIFLKNSKECSEGVATYCSLHIQESSKDSLLDFLYHSIPKNKRNAVYEEQKRMISKVNSLPDNNYYKTGYENAENIARKYGFDAVLMSAMLSHCVPFYNYDILGTSESFAEICKYLYNVDARWDYFISLDEHIQKSAFSSIKQCQNINDVFEFIDKQERPKRKWEYWDINIYYYYYLLLHSNTIEPICKIYGKDVIKDVEDYIRVQMLKSFAECNSPVDFEENTDVFFSQLCDPIIQSIVLQSDDYYIYFLNNAIHSICKSKNKPKCVSQITEEDTKRLIARSLNVGNFNTILYNLRNANKN